MTPQGEVEHVNRQALDYFGRTLEELKQWGPSDAVHPDDLPRVSAAWAHSIATGVPYETRCGLGNSILHAGDSSHIRHHTR